MKKAAITTILIAAATALAGCVGIDRSYVTEERIVVPSYQGHTHTTPAKTTTRTYVVKRTYVYPASSYRTYSNIEYPLIFGLGYLLGHYINDGHHGRHYYRAPRRHFRRPIHRFRHH